MRLSSASAARATIASLASAARSTASSRSIGRVGLEARHRQQLVDEMRGAVHARLELAHCARPVCIVLRALGEADLQLQCGKRRAQLVRGIRGEPALGGQRLVEAREQRVEAVGEGPQLLGHVVRGERRHRVGPALGHGARHPVERGQGHADDVPDERAQHGNERCERQERAQCHFRRDLLPLVHRMRDLQRVRAFDVRVDAPIAAVELRVRVAFRRRAPETRRRAATSTRGRRRGPRSA